MNVAPKSGGMLETGEPGAEQDDDGNPLDRVMESLGFRKPAAKPAAVPKTPAPVQNRVQPEQNGEDAPTMEQLSMLIGRLAEKVDGLCDIIHAQNRGGQHE